MKSKQQNGVQHLSNDIDGKCPTQQVNQSNRVTGREVRQADSITNLPVFTQDNDKSQTLDDFSNFCVQNTTIPPTPADFVLYEKYFSESPVNSGGSANLDSNGSGFGGLTEVDLPDEWHGEEEKSTLAQEVNAPRGSADNTTDAANQTTCIRGSKMLDYNTSAPARGVPPTPSIIRINQQYLGDSVANACKEWRFLLVKSDKGTGKTTAMKVVICSLDEAEAILFVTPRKKLNYALAHDLGLYYYEYIKNEPDKAKRKMMARRMVVTPQSLGAIIAEFPDIKYRHIVLDESEAVASMLVSSVTKSKSQTVKALKEVAANAGNVVLMDAAIGNRSKRLMKILRGAADVGALTNQFKRWKNITAEILTGGKYSDRVEISNAQQIEAIRRGERIGISSGSATYCTDRYSVLKTMFPDLKIGLFTGKSGAEVARILANPALAGEYDVLIFSPAVSIGVSFDIQNHFHTVFGVYPNVTATGDSDDAIQGMARIRHPSLNRWVVVLDDEKQIFKNADVIGKFSEDIEKVISERFSGESWFAGCPVELTTEDTEVINLWSVCQSYHIHNKNNFNQQFRKSLTGSGVKIVNVPVSELESNQESNDLTESAKESRKEQAIKAKTESPKIEEMGYYRLKDALKYRPEDVTAEQLGSMERYRFEDRFNIDCDTLKPSELEKFLALDDDNVISKCQNREIALSGNDFTKKYVKARITGLDGSDAFKVDSVDEKLIYRMKKRLTDYAVPYFGGDEYSHASLKKGAMVKFIERNLKEIIITEVMPLPKDWKTKPAAVMSYLLDICGYKHTSSQRKIDGKRHTINTAIPDSHVDDICQMRKETGKDWITQTLRIMGLFEEVAKTPEGLTRLERLWQDVGRTDDIEAFMNEFSDDIEQIEAGVFPDWKMKEIIQNWQVA